MDREAIIRAIIVGVILGLIGTTINDAAKKISSGIIERVIDKLVESDRQRTRTDGPLPNGRPTTKYGDSGASPSGGLVLTFKNAYGKPVRLALFTRDATLGPGGSRYRIEPDGERTYGVECKKGETVSYGAEALGGDRVWGAGLSDDHPCEHCRLICDGSALAFVLDR